MINTLTPGTLSSIGRIVARMHPELARNLARIIAETKPTCSDLTHVEDLLLVFCQMKGIYEIPKDSTTSTLYLKHVFLAAILRLYNPEILKGIYYTKMQRGLRSELAYQLRWSPNCISNCIPLIRTRLRVYEEFESDVTEVCTEFRNYIKRNVTD